LQPLTNIPVWSLKGVGHPIGPAVLSSFDLAVYPAVFPTITPPVILAKVSSVPARIRPAS
jgi:hypothetical protein